MESALKARRHARFSWSTSPYHATSNPKSVTWRDVYLYTVDDLAGSHPGKPQVTPGSRRTGPRNHHFSRSTSSSPGSRSLDAVSLIQDYRNQAESTRDEVLAKAQPHARIRQNPEEALQFLAHTLTNKLLHVPSSQMREAGSNCSRPPTRCSELLGHKLPPTPAPRSAPTAPEKPDVADDETQNPTKLETSANHAIEEITALLADPDVQVDRTVSRPEPGICAARADRATSSIRRSTMKSPAPRKCWPTRKWPSSHARHQGCTTA